MCACQIFFSKRNIFCRNHVLGFSFLWSSQIGCGRGLRDIYHGRCVPCRQPQCHRMEPFPTLWRWLPPWYRPDMIVRTHTVVRTTQLRCPCTGNTLVFLAQRTLCNPCPTPPLPSPPSPLPPPPPPPQAVSRKRALSLWCLFETALGCRPWLASTAQPLEGGSDGSGSSCAMNA